MSWKRFVLVVSLVVCATLPSGASQADAAAPATPRRGGTLRLCRPSDLRSLDPALAYDTASTPLAKLLFRGLLNFGDGVDLVPDQAEDWSVSPDGRTYTFHLRAGVRFCNGRPVEAADYVFSFERILNPKTSSPGQTFFLDILGAPEFAAGKAAHVAGLRAPDPRTFVVQLREPRFTFRYILAMNFADVVPRDVVQHYGDDFQYHLAGSGPYKLESWRRGIQWSLIRNHYYSGPDGYVDRVEMEIGPDPTTAAMMLERGEVDLILGSPAEAVRFKRNSRLNSWLQPVDTASTDYLFMNTEMKPFDDVRVRRAVNYAINKKRLLKLTGGFNTIAQGIVPPSMGWSNPGRHRYEYDPEKARALLREAGFPNGFRTELWYMVDLPILARLAAGAQQDLQQIGIEADLKPANGSTFNVKAQTRGQIPLGVWGWFQDYPDPSNFLDVLFNGERITDTDCNNVSFYNNPSVNRLLETAVGHMDQKDRTQRFREAETLIMDDAPWVPLVHEQMPFLKNPRLHSGPPHPVWLWKYENMWIEP